MRCFNIALMKLFYTKWMTLVKRYTVRATLRYLHSVYPDAYQINRQMQVSPLRQNKLFKIIEKDFFPILCSWLLLILSLLLRLFASCLTKNRINWHTFIKRFFVRCSISIKSFKSGWKCNPGQTFNDKKDCINREKLDMPLITLLMNWCNFSLSEYDVDTLEKLLLETHSDS